MNPYKQIYRAAIALMTLVLLSSSVPSQAQDSETADWAAYLSGEYRVVANMTYLTANNWDAKLDVYTPREATGPCRPSFTSTEVVGSEEARKPAS